MSVERSELRPEHTQVPVASPTGRCGHHRGDHRRRRGGHGARSTAHRSRLDHQRGRHRRPWRRVRSSPSTSTSPRRHDRRALVDIEVYSLNSSGSGLATVLAAGLGRPHVRGRAADRAAGRSGRVPDDEPTNVHWVKVGVFKPGWGSPVPLERRRDVVPGDDDAGPDDDRPADDRGTDHDATAGDDGGPDDDPAAGDDDDGGADDDGGPDHDSTADDDASADDRRADDHAAAATHRAADDAAAEWPAVLRGLRRPERVRQPVRSRLLG